MAENAAVLAFVLNEISATLANVSKALEQYTVTGVLIPTFTPPSPATTTEGGSGKKGGRVKKIKRKRCVYKPNVWSGIEL